MTNVKSQPNEFSKDKVFALVKYIFDIKFIDNFKYRLTIFSWQVNQFKGQGKSNL